MPKLAFTLTEVYDFAKQQNANLGYKDENEFYIALVEEIPDIEQTFPDAIDTVVDVGFSYTVLLKEPILQAQGYLPKLAKEYQSNLPFYVMLEP